MTPGASPSTRCRRADTLVGRSRSLRRQFRREFLGQIGASRRDGLGGGVGSDQEDWHQETGDEDRTPDVISYAYAVGAQSVDIGGRHCFRGLDYGRRLRKGIPERV